MAFLEALFGLPSKVKSFLTPTSKKRGREQATENIEVESLPDSKRQATTTRFVVEEPKQGLRALQSHALLDTKVNRTNTAITPIALPKTSFTWGKFEPHSTHRPRNNNYYRGGEGIKMQQPKSLLAPVQVEKDAKDLELYKSGVEAHRILEAIVPPRAFSKGQNYAGATAAAAPTAADGFKSQQAAATATAAAATKAQQANKFQEIVSQYTNEFRSTFAAKNISLDYLRHDGAAATATAGAKEAQLASEKYNQRLLALKTSMEIAKKAVEDSKVASQRDKKTAFELKELEDNMSRMKALRLAKPEEEEKEVRVPLPKLTEEDYQEYKRLIRQRTFHLFSLLYL